MPQHIWLRSISYITRGHPSANLADASHFGRGYFASFTVVFHSAIRPKDLAIGASEILVSRRIIPKGAGDIAHLTVISNLQVELKVIYNKLQKGIDQFEASIFGDFTRMKTVKFCGGFVHHLLLRQLYNDDPHVIEFEFNGVGATFDRKAFVMFTGLNCGKFPKKSEMRNLSYNLWTKYFGESGPITQIEFGQAFKDIEFKYENDQEIWDNVKCCMFLFLETMLLPADRSRLVKKNNFTIIENDNLLEKYPWGNLCYDLTISSLRSKMETGKRGHPTVFTDFFLHFRYPRMLGYQFPNILHYNRLANDVFNKKQQIVTYMPPPPSPALEQEPHHLIHVVWDPFKQVDKKKKAALSKFLKDRKSKLSTVDGFDKISKEVYNLFLASGGWLNNNDPHVDEDIEQNIDWASEMNETPFTKVDIPSRHITLYDSAIKMTPTSWFQIKNARPLAVLFLYLLMVNEYYTHHPDQTLDLTPFRMTREEDSSLPQQISDGDCSVYALKYIEYLVARWPFDFNCSHIALSREKYAVEIFHNEM
ncbi:hypothetical protein FNV43_RR00536 [Rhamnella rubrinervis]|uniref:Ubiquitin-like protease family profile domain-containing protein n=1 Tax=Rhamnella rubrinervis TaxID=2594499 RepID=A0A8K0HQU7_9ROSA|nr:hypothetical protein FNV43_RR00536 [Rhamnella rubrinervis]